MLKEKPKLSWPDLELIANLIHHTTDEVMVTTHYLAPSGIKALRSIQKRLTAAVFTRYFGENPLLTETGEKKPGVEQKEGIGVKHIVQ